MFSLSISTAFVTYNPWSELRKSEKKMYTNFQSKLRVRVILQ